MRLPFVPTLALAASAFVFAVSPARAQEDGVRVPILVPPSAGVTAADRAFADSLVGSWTGSLRIWTADGTPDAPQTVEMGIDVVPIAGTDTAYAFTLRYGDADVRPYALLVRGGGRYAIDEGGGLVLDALRRGPLLVSAFASGRSRLVVSYERGRDADGPFLRFEVTAVPTAVDRRIAPTPGRIDPVLVYGVASYHVAVLRPAVAARRRP